MVEHPEPVTPSIHKHRHEFTWKIIFPLIIVAIIIITGGVIISLGVAGSLSLWSDISLIWVLLPALFMAFIAMVILAVAIYGMARLIKVTPRFSSKAQDLSVQAATNIQKMANATTKPFLWLGQAGAALRALFRIRV